MPLKLPFFRSRTINPRVKGTRVETKGATEALFHLHRVHRGIVRTDHFSRYATRRDEDGNLAKRVDVHLMHSARARHGIQRTQQLATYRVTSGHGLYYIHTCFLPLTGQIIRVISLRAARKVAREEEAQQERGAVRKRQRKKLLKLLEGTSSADDP